MARSGLRSGDPVGLRDGQRDPAGVLPGRSGGAGVVSRRTCPWGWIIFWARMRWARTSSGFWCSASAIRCFWACWWGLAVTIISTIVGLSAGYIGGAFERVVMMVVDSFITIPLLPILIILGALIRGNTTFLSVGRDHHHIRLGLGGAHRAVDGADPARAGIHQHGPVFRGGNRRHPAARNLSRMSRPSSWSASSTPCCSPSTPKRRWR